MKILFILLFLVSCNGLKTREEVAIIEEHHKRTECKSYVMNFEAALLNTHSYGSTDICDLDVRNELCGCSGIKKLPLDCFGTQYKIDRKIERKMKDIKDANEIIAELRHKKKFKAIELVKTLIDGYKEEIDILNTNKDFYANICNQNEAI